MKGTNMNETKTNIEYESSCSECWKEFPESELFAVETAKGKVLMCGSCKIEREENVQVCEDCGDEFEVLIDRCSVCDACARERSEIRREDRAAFAGSDFDYTMNA
jgi:Zn finger protein HypA/HybF involved in hydrogenase expression